MAPITARELNRATLSRQGLLEPIAARSAGAAVERLGSLQAQHPEWPPYALAARTANTRTANLAGALERRTVVRSSLMRVTIHVSENADVLPTILLDGKVAGTWELARTDGARRIELRPFGRLSRADREALEAEAERILTIASPPA